MVEKVLRIFSFKAEKFNIDPNLNFTQQYRYLHAK